MNITINADLSSTIISEDGLKQCGLPTYNPETLTPFNNEDEVTAYVNKIYGNPKFFTTISIPSYRTSVNPLEFKLLFTSNERVAINSLALTDPLIQDHLDILNNSLLTKVDLTSQTTIDIITYMVTVSLLTQERADEILLGILE